MVLSNQVTLRIILVVQDDLSAPEVCMSGSAFDEKKKVDALLFLNNNIEELAVLPAGGGSLDNKLVKRILDQMPIVSLVIKKYYFNENFFSFY